jgi:putative ABC transport system permease protein
MDQFIENLLNPINLTATVIAAAVLVSAVVYAALRPRFFLLMLKNLRRNRVRTLLICTATVVLVAMVTLIWTVVYFLDQATRDRAKNFKIIVTERWQLPSQMPQTHANYLDPDHSNFLPELAGKYTNRDFMTWSFYGGSTEKGKFTRESIVFFFAMKPEHVRSMMDDLDTLDPELIKKMENNRRGVLMGKERLKMIDKKVGERFSVYSLNYKEIDLEFEVVGQLPEGRYDQSAIMNADYFHEALDRYKQQHGGTPHSLDQKRLNLIWLRVPDKASFNEIGNLIENSPVFASTPVKVETASSGIGNFLEAYKDLLWGMKFLLVPTILAIMALVVANAISISVRERRTELAVMKVLGFKPGQILNLVLGESLLIGSISGLAAAGFLLAAINATGGIKFPIAFFPAFQIPMWALAWGPAMGCATAFLGSFWPAWQARSVNVSEVFAKVA